MAQPTSPIAQEAAAIPAAVTVSTRLAQYGLATSDAYAGSLVVSLAIWAALVSAVERLIR